ncbi:DUF1016 N-terminal domain-containing protein [Rhodococcus pyridinivorans]|uniref:DUF1016 N-terminal domain-containing protein n=1 Tax=Rhodococcus pyridinivorans TaxID=103816 RepID=UPI000BA29EC7|nr:DUF1016 N-terminal domain-containing protein [Rhodococcus pyridinivorans]
MAEMERNVEIYNLFGQVSGLIEQTRAAVTAPANADLSLTNWQIGHPMDTEVLTDQRAGYTPEFVVTLSQQLTKPYRRGFDPSNRYLMRKFAQVFPDCNIVAMLSLQLSWSHFIALIAMDRDAAQAFYIQQTRDARLGVRAPRELDGRHGFERRETQNAQTSGGSAVPLHTLANAYSLGLLGLKDAYTARDFGDEFIRELETFLLETGNGWAGVGGRSNRWRRARTASSRATIGRRCHRKKSRSSGSCKPIALRKNESDAPHSGRDDEDDK